jgi:prepilin-type N-terminal cleavage/methylation domain-containing protein
MTKSPTQLFRRSAGFTLVELLVVIAIIAILAGLLLPVLGAAMTRARKSTALYEMNNLAAAINQYDSANGRMPASKAAALSANPDFTFGTVIGAGMLATPLNNSKGQPLPRIQNNGTGANYQAANSEIIAILTDAVTLPDGSTPTINAGHLYNPSQSSFFTPHMSGDKISHGVGTDLVYRDPWGNPYIVTWT